jgi:hypothetical protein
MQPFIQTAPTRRFVTPGTTSARLPISVVGAMASIRVYNGTNQIIGVAEGDNSIVASLADNHASGTTPIPPGSVEILRVPSGVTNVAVIAAAASTGDVFVSPGDGM